MDTHPEVAKAMASIADAVSDLRGRRVLVVLPDRTRPFPAAEILPPLNDVLLAAGVEPRRLVYAVASGTHVPSEQDSAPLEGHRIPGSVLLLPDPDGDTALAGITSRGTEVRVQPILFEAEVTIALGRLVLHYFAGFGGGGKMLFPGLGARRSIAQNHRLALAPIEGLADGVEPGRVSDNPVALDLREAHRLLPPALHLTMDHFGGARGLSTWNDFEFFDELCSMYADACRSGRRHAADVVRVAAHGPAGIDVVQAHKVLFHAALYAKDGADILLHAKCPEGIGSPALARWLSKPDRATLERDARAAYDLNAQTAISLASIAARTRVLWCATQPLPELERWGIRVVAHPEELDRRAWMAKAEGRSVLTLEDPTSSIPMR